MSVSVQTPLNNYVANGSVTNFVYDFRIIEQEDLKVYLDAVLQTSGYTVTGIDNAEGGSVIFTTAPAASTAVRLQRRVELNRTTDYVEGGRLPTDTIDRDFDRIVMQVQDLDQSTIRQDGDGKYDVGGNVIKGVDRIEYLDGRLDEGGFIPVSWEFISTGETSYQLPIATNNNANLYVVTDNGLVLSPLTYAINSTEQILTFLSGTPISGNKIVVRLFGRVPDSYENSINFNNIKRSFVFTSLAAQTTFTTTTDNDLVNMSTDVYINGSKVLYELDYLLSGKSVIFVVALSVGDVVEIVVNNAIVAVNTTTVISGGGGTGGDSWNWVTKTADYTASAFDGIFANTSAGGITITLTPFPLTGDRIKIVDVAGTFTDGNLTIGGNGFKIMSLDEDMTVTTNNKSIELVYSGPTYGWKVV